MAQPMTETVFPILPQWRVRRSLAVALGLLAFVAGIYAARQLGWGWWLFVAAMLGLTIYNLLGLTRQAFVAKVGPSGVTVSVVTGREIHADWGEIEAHMIDPARRVGGLVLRAGARGRVRILPVSTGLMGPEAAKQLIALMQERLPKLEYRVPSMGAARVKKDS